MKDKNREQDNWISKTRMPFDGVFARMNKECRYLGREKTEFQALMQALSYNLKRLIKIESETIPIF